MSDNEMENEETTCTAGEANEDQTENQAEAQPDTTIEEDVCPGKDEDADQEEAGSSDSPTDDDAPEEAQPAEEAPGTAESTTAEGSTAVEDAADAEDTADTEDEPAASTDEPTEKSRNNAKTAGIVACSIIGVLIVAYLAVAVFFTMNFYPNTTLGKNDISLQSGDQVKGALTTAAADYKLSVTGYGMDLTIKASDVNLSADPDTMVASILEGQQAFLWPARIWGDHDASASLTATISESKLSEIVKTAVEKANAAATPPTNAAVSFNATLGKFEVAKEKLGTQLDANVVTKTCAAALTALQTSVALSESELAKPAITSTEPSLQKTCDAANAFLTVNLTLTMGDTPATAVDAAAIASMLEFAADGTVSLPDANVVAWVNQIASDFSTVGKERTYTRPDGKACTVSGGTYGWTVIRSELLALVRDAITNSRTGTAEIPVTAVMNGWTSANQDWGKRYCDVDLTEQHARFYDESGALVWESDIVSGAYRSSDTPTGVYYLNKKQSPSTLVGAAGADGKPSYVTTVSYWMPFVGNSIGLHDATWQPDFGGQMYREGYGSHGCVNLPLEAAAEIYGIIQLGDVVVVHW